MDSELPTVSTSMQFSENPQNIFQTNGPIGNGPRRKATACTGAGTSDRCREDGMSNRKWNPGGKLYKKRQINFGPAYLFKRQNAKLVNSSCNCQVHVSPQLTHVGPPGLT